MEALEVGAERMLDTVEQIRLKYVPSGPKRHTMDSMLLYFLISCTVVPIPCLFLWVLNELCESNEFLAHSNWGRSYLADYTGHPRLSCISKGDSKTNPTQVFFVLLANASKIANKFKLVTLFAEPLRNSARPSLTWRSAKMLFFCMTL